MHALHSGGTHRIEDMGLLLYAGMDTALWGEDARWPGPRQAVGEVTSVPVSGDAAPWRRKAAWSTS